MSVLQKQAKRTRLGDTDMDIRPGYSSDRCMGINMMLSVVI